MKAIGKFFKAIGDFLTDAEDYVDYRVKTGKFVGDIKDLNQRNKENSSKKIASSLRTAYKSPVSQYLLRIFNVVWKELLKIPIFEIFVALGADAFKILVKYYAQVFIVFALTLPSAILLVNFFKNSPQMFFLWFLPILFYNTYCLSGLYYFIDRQEKGEKVSFWKSFLVSFSELLSLIFSTSIHIAIILVCVIGFSLLTLFFSFFFEAIDIVWGSSFYYWFIVIFVGIFIGIGLFIVTIIIHQAYFDVLLEQKKFQLAFKRGWQAVKVYPFQFLFFYLLLYLYAAVFTSWATLYYLYVGIAVSVYILIQTSLFLGFLLRRKYQSKILFQDEVGTVKTAPIFIIIAIFGMVNYVLIAVAITKQYPYVTAAIEKQRENYFLTQDLATYTNSLYRYTIQYPKNWTVYERKGSSITFYNNKSATTVGGIWLDVAVLPYSEKEFKRLYLNRPGLVSFDTDSKNVTTKISNVTIQGYAGVIYTYTKSDEPYPQYQTHYLIHKGDYMYDLIFTTLDRNVEGNNSDTFERIAGTFRFNE